MFFIIAQRNITCTARARFIDAAVEDRKLIMFGQIEILRGILKASGDLDRKLP